MTWVNPAAPAYTPDATGWGEFFHDDKVAVPIIDRIIHHSYLYLLGGESYRLKQKTLS